MPYTCFVDSEKRASFWLSRVRACLFSIPLLIVSCGTAPQLALQGQVDSSANQEITHPQAYYHFLRGSLAELNNDGSKAVEAYQAGLTFDPDSIFLKFRIAKLHFALAHMTAAVEMAKQIPFEQITNVGMYLDLAKIFSGAGERDQALQLFVEGEKKLPFEQRLYLAHGNMLLADKDFQEAEGIFRRLLYHVPESAEAHYYLGLIAVEKSQKLEALGHLEQAIGLNTSFERAYINFVELLEEVGESERAIESIQTFLKEVNPHHREFRLRLIRLHVAQKDGDQAIKHLNYLLEQNPGDLHAQVRKAQVYVEQGNFAAAIDELNAVLRDRPNEFTSARLSGTLV